MLIQIEKIIKIIERFDVKEKKNSYQISYSLTKN